MASLPRMITDSARQLRDMSLSQRLAIAFGVLLVASSLVWLTQWAATPEMVPLLDQPLSAEDLSLVRGGLESIGQDHRVDGSRVLVPASANRQSLLALLQQSEKLPTDTSIGFAALVKESNPWISQEENNRRWTVAMKTELERVLRGMAGVKQASVFLNLNTRERGFSRETAAGSASVTLAMKGGEPVPRSLALAAARLVAGAVRGLPLRNVEVLDSSGRVALEWEAEDGESASGLRRLQAQQEHDIENKIQRLLDFDPKLRVKVQVVLDLTSRRTESSEPADGVPVSETTSETVTARNRGAGQPGVEPNVGVSAGGSGSDETSRTETREARYQPGVTTSSQATPAGGVQKIFAAINLSHSYLFGVLKRQQPDLQTATEEQIQQVFEKQKARIQNQVSKLVQPPETEQVAVDWYYDVSDPAPQVEEAGAVDSSLDLARRYGPASALGLLALLALGLLMRVSRAGDRGEAFGLEIGLPKEAIEAARRAAQDLQSQSAAAPGRGGAAPSGAGGAAATSPAMNAPTGLAAEGVLEAQELDEGMMQVNSMVEQVSKAVGEDSDSVAALLGSWIERGQ